MITEKIDFLSAKITGLLIISAIPAGGLSFFQDLTGWYVENRIFMSFIAAAIFIDHGVGSWVHYRIEKDFSWKENRNGLLIKVGGSIVGYVLFEMFYQIVQDVNFVSMYIKILLQVTTFAYPAYSAMENIKKWTKGKFPPDWIMLKFKKFNKTGDLETFKTARNEDEISSNNISRNDNEQLPE